MKRVIKFTLLLITLQLLMILSADNIYAQDASETEPAPFEEQSNTDKEDEVIYADSSKGFSADYLYNHIKTYNGAPNNGEIVNGIDPGSDPDAPVDSWLYLFILSGLFYGMRKYRRALNY